MAITTIEGGDDLINAAEAAGGITVSGTAEIGATLTVNGAAVTVDASGAWTTSVTPPAGDGPLTVTAVATDAAGNTATATHELTVDTLPPAVAITTIEGGDDLINAAEAAGGITVSGTAEIGSTLTVNGAAVTVDASGGWTTSVAPPAVDGPLTVTAVATDAAGNTATATHALTVDTLPPAVAITTIEGGDDLINAAEAAGGITVSGTAEIGSTLTVNGAAVTVDASGAWTTSVSAGGRRPADGDGGGHRRGRQHRDGDARADGRHAGAGGVAITTIDGERRRLASTPRGRGRHAGGGGPDRDGRRSGDDADGERGGGDGRRHAGGWTTPR